MPEYTITLKRACGIPPGFTIVHQTIDNEPVSWLERTLDARRARITWEDGEARYTPQYLSSHMAEDKDFDDPLLKGFL